MYHIYYSIYLLFNKLPSRDVFIDKENIVANLLFYIFKPLTNLIQKISDPLLNNFQKLKEIQIIKKNIRHFKNTVLYK